MSAQSKLSQFGAEQSSGDIGAWRHATDEPGFWGERQYWRTDDYVLVAKPSHFAVYDVETWESGILGQGNDPVVKRQGFDNGIRRAKAWLRDHRDGGVER